MAASYSAVNANGSDTTAGTIASAAADATRSEERSGTSAHKSGEPVVSVIIIFLNARKFLREAVGSVRRQTFARWEVLLVDDGSGDGSAEIARTLCARDTERIRYLEHTGHKNCGMSASRNLGLAEARGRYVAFLDADDIYLPERLERHVRILDSMPGVDMVQSDHLWWNEWQAERDRFDENHQRPFAWKNDGVVEPPEALMTILAAPLFSTLTCSITVRHATALELGGFENAFRTLYEDQAFLTKIYLERQIYVMQSCLAKCRVHSSSCTNSLSMTAHRRTGTWQREARALIKWQSEYVAQRGIEHPVLDEQLQQRLRYIPRLVRNGVSVMLRGYSYKGMRRLLPYTLYIAFMRWRRRLLETRTWSQYAELQSLLEAYEATLQQAGVENRDRPAL